MKTLAGIGLVLALGCSAAPAYAGQSPVQRIILQERARKHDPRLYSPGAMPLPTALSPAERIITQENARNRDAGLLAAATTPSTPTIQIVQPGGFHWTDAGIGAAATLGLFTLAAGTLTALRHQRLRK